MYELRGSDDGGLTWDRLDVFAYRIAAEDAAEDAWDTHGVVAVFHDGREVYRA